MIVTAIAGLVLLGPQKHHKHFSTPWWVTHSIVGEDSDHPGIYDPKTGFMLYTGGDCDGADLYSTLTADRYEVAGQGFEVPDFQPLYGKQNGDQEMKIAHLPLRTTRGIKIGDTPDQLVAKVGKPKEIQVTGSRKQFRTYHYERHSSHMGRSYHEDYTFKAGKLIEISLISYDDNAG